MGSLLNYLQENIDSRLYYETILEESWGPDATEVRIKCLFHSETRGSLQLNLHSGAWHCMGCDEGGKSVVSFHSKLRDISFREAQLDLFHQLIHPVVDKQKIRNWVRRLRKTPSVHSYLEDRFISNPIIHRFNIGFDGDRFTLPIENEFGITVNVKLHHPTKEPKMLNYQVAGEPRKFGSPAMLYPLPIIMEEQSRIVVCEGEFDALLLNSIGINAVSSTTGAKSWPHQYNDLFTNLEVVVIYDNDETGQIGTKLVIRNLMSCARSIKVLKIPRKFGKDVTDWVRAQPSMIKAKNWIKRFEHLDPVVENQEVIEPTSSLTKLSLSEASNARWYNKRVCVNALVTGKDITPYLVTKKARVVCHQLCDNCDCGMVPNDFFEVELDPKQEQILKMIDITDKQRTATIMNLASLPCKNAMYRIEEVEKLNIEQVLLIPTLDSKTNYVMRPSYYIGHGLVTNRAYQFEGITVPTPRDQHTTHIFDRAVPIQNEIDGFELSRQIKTDLKSAFSTHGNEEEILDKLYEIADWQSRHVTQIRERPELHVAIDLVYHSIRSFTFNSELVARGMLDVLVIGDTRCGKGSVAEGLKNFYGLGEIASGENCSFAGLVGGLQQAGTRWMITWGLIPLNHERIVIIDEASSLSEREIGQMSRVRSEGVAEISKIIRESTHASTRLLWLSNPRSGRPIMTYNTGAQAIKELMGSNEDVSRFDFAITVATDEVDSGTINIILQDEYFEDREKYNADLFRNLILWSWSRTAEQVKFTKGAVRQIIRSAIKFGHEYSPTIPLIQSENFRIKLAKISTAVAARVFSTDKPAQSVIVKKYHVRAAIQFLEELYTKPSMAYDLFSQSVNKSVSKEVKTIREAFANLGSETRFAMKGILEESEITAEHLADYTGDIHTAKILLGQLVRLGCLRRLRRGQYVKNTEFQKWLRKEV